VAKLNDLLVVLGDQLDLDAAALDGFDAGVDAVWMAEAFGAAAMGFGRHA
jgi:deoxyribodipyrimidine photolyase-related protein